LLHPIYQRPPSAVRGHRKGGRFHGHSVCRLESLAQGSPRSLGLPDADADDECAAERSAGRAALGGRAGHSGGDQGEQAAVAPGP